MREARGVPAPSPAAAVWPIFAGLGALTWAVVAGQHTRPAAMLLLALLVFSVGYRWIFAWPTLIGTTILVILWIPIRRFELPGSLPFSLEPYRVMILVLGLCWVASLLVDRRVQLRRTPIDGPLLLVVLVAAASVAANSGRLADGAVNDSVWKAMLFLVSYPIFFYAVVSVTKTYADVERLVRIFVAGGAVVALFAIVEAGNLPVELDAQLETVARSNFGGTLPAGFTAHPKRDPKTDELWAAVYSPIANAIQVVVVGKDGRVRRTVDVPTPGSVMVHDCAITEKYFVLLDLPVVFTPG